MLRTAVRQMLPHSRIVRDVHHVHVMLRNVREGFEI